MLSQLRSTQMEFPSPSSPAAADSADEASERWLAVLSGLPAPAVQTAGGRPGDGGPPSPAFDPSDAEGAVEAKLQDLAADPEAFHEKMEATYGDNYDRATAENLRQKILKGDFSWMPEAEVRSDEKLHGAQGAYHSDTQSIYLNENLTAAQAEETYAHEVGHRLDDIFGAARGAGASDTQGDEGLMFQMLLDDEISVDDRDAIQEIRAIDDGGTMIDETGREVAVENFRGETQIMNQIEDPENYDRDGRKGEPGEFWKALGNVVREFCEDPIGFLEKAAASVADFVEGAAKAVVTLVKETVEGIVEIFKDPVGFAKGLWDMITNPEETIKGMIEGCVELGKKLFSGDAEKMGEAFVEIVAEVGPGKVRHLAGVGKGKDLDAPDEHRALDDQDAPDKPDAPDQQDAPDKPHAPDQQDAPDKDAPDNRKLDQDRERVAAYNASLFEGLTDMVALDGLADALARKDKPAADKPNGPDRPAGDKPAAADRPDAPDGDEARLFDHPQEQRAYLANERLRAAEDPAAAADAIQTIRLAAEELVHKGEIDAARAVIRMGYETARARVGDFRGSPEVHDQFMKLRDRAIDMGVEERDRLPGGASDGTPPDAGDGASASDQGEGSGAHTPTASQVPAEGPQDSHKRPHEDDEPEQASKRQKKQDDGQAPAAENEQDAEMPDARDPEPATRLVHLPPNEWHLGKDVQKELGTHGGKEKDKDKWGNEPYGQGRVYKGMDGSTHESEHVIPFEALSDGQKAGTSRNGLPEPNKMINFEAPAYHEVKEFHRNHIGTSSGNKKPDMKPYGQPTNEHNPGFYPWPPNDAGGNPVEYGEDFRFSGDDKRNAEKIDERPEDISEDKWEDMDAPERRRQHALRTPDPHQTEVYRQQVKQLLQNGDPATAFQLNSLGYSFEPKFRQMHQNPDIGTLQAIDSYKLMIQHLVDHPITFRHNDGEIYQIQLTKDELIEITVSRRLAESGEWEDRISPERIKEVAEEFGIEIDPETAKKLGIPSINPSANPGPGPNPSAGPSEPA